MYASVGAASRAAASVVGLVALDEPQRTQQWEEEASERPVDLEKALRLGKWSFERQTGGHKIFHRSVLYAEDPEKPEVQTISFPCTPSDVRWRKNALRDLRHKDDGVITAVACAEGDEKLAGGEMRYALLMRELEEVEQQRKAKEQALEGLDIERARIENDIDAIAW